MLNTMKHHSRAYFVITKAPKILLPVLGVTFILFAPHLTACVAYLVCAILLVEALFLFIKGVRSREYRQRDTKLLACALILAVLALLVFFKRHDCIELLGIIWGILGLSQAITLFNEAFYRMAHRQAWWWVLLEALVELSLAILLLWDPNHAFTAHIRILGIQLILHAFMPKHHAADTEPEATQSPQQDEELDTVPFA